MSAPRTVPPAPAPAHVPLPNPQKPPTGNEAKKKYSEGSMYEDLSPEDIEAWHRRYSEFKKWRQEIPNEQIRNLGSNGGNGNRKGNSSVDLGIGSADWDWREPSECGTIPSTIVERAWQTARATTANNPNLGPQAEPPAPNAPKSQSNLSKRTSKANLITINENLQARVKTFHTGSSSETPPSEPPSRATTIRPPLTQKSIPPQNIANASAKDRTPTIEIQPPSIKAPTQNAIPSQKSAQPKKTTVSPSDHPAPIKVPATSTKPTRPPPTPLLAQPPSHDRSIKPTSEPVIYSRSPSTRGSGVPGEQVIPSPTLSTKYAEREAYIASALSLPLDMLIETEGPKPKKVDSSSQFTTGRLDSLLGRNGNGNGRNGSRTKGSQRSAGSSTTLPSVPSDRPVERTTSQLDSKNSQLARSKTTSAIPTKTTIGGKSTAEPREHHYEGSNHLPVPGAVSAKPESPSEATIIRATKQPLPPSSHIQSQLSTVTANKPTSSQTHQDRQPIQTSASDAIIVRASREPLPLSVASTAIPHETIKVPVSVKTMLASSGPATKAPSTETTVIRAGQIPLPAATGRTGTHRSVSSTVRPTYENQDAPLSPRDIPLPPTALTAKSTIVPDKESAPTHRQQMPLPRPALTPHPSFDGLTKATSFGRKHRDPSVGDLTAHFAPNIYPLPPSGATLFSSPENMGTVPPQSTAGHEVAFTTIEYMPPASLQSTAIPSTPGIQPLAKSKSNKSMPPPTPMTRALAIPLPPSTAVLSVKSTQNTIPSAPAPSSASPPAPPPPPVTSPVQPSPVVLTVQEPVVHQATSHRSAQVPAEAAPVIHDPVQSQSPPQAHPRIHFSPGQVSESLRSDDDHVSFTVPSGSRGRLKVTIKWFRDSARSERSSPRGTRISVVEEDTPPPLPPKTSSLMSKVIGKSTQKAKTSSERPPSSDQRTSRADAPQRSEQSRHSQQFHPLPEHQRPDLSPAPPKRDNPKSPSASDEFPPNQQAQQQHHPSGPAPHYNPYYSGATLPAYAAAMPQVYNMFSPPMAYPQPGQPHWNTPQVAGMYRPAQPGMNGRPPADPTSPARESVDPPSDVDLPPVPQPQQPISGFPPQVMGINGYPQMQNSQQAYWNSMQRPSIWQRMFRRPDPQGEEGDNLGPDDSVTIRNWRNGVVPGGRTPTMLPNPRGGVPTIIPNQPNPSRPTLAPTAYAYPGVTNNGNTLSGPGTTLYNARGGYPDNAGRSRRGRGESPGVWEKLMYRRQTEEAVYRSPPRRRRDLPDPGPARIDRGRSIFARTKIRDNGRARDRWRDENDNVRDKYGRSGGRDDMRRKEKLERYEKRQIEKEERRRQRSLRRDQRVMNTTNNQNGYNPYGTGLRREHFVVVQPKDRPNDLGENVRGGRSGTLVGEWVGRFGMGRSRGQFPNPESQVRTYQPKLWKDRLDFNRRNTTTTPTTRPGQTIYPQPQPQPQPLGTGRKQTLRRTTRTTEGVFPNSLGLNTGEAQNQRTGAQTQNQGMRGMIGRLNLGRRDAGGVGRR